MCYTTLGFCHIFNAYNKCSPCGIIIFYSCLDRLTLVTGQYANATLTITPPASTQSGTDVTLTIDAQSSNGVDSNYAVLRLSVVTKVSQWNKQKRFWTYPHKLLVKTCPTDQKLNVDSPFTHVKHIFLLFQITDFIQPLCKVVSVQDNKCPHDLSQCGHFQWGLSANITDGNGTGIESISLHQGNGTLSYTSLSAPIIVANYNASCCSQTVEIIAVDKVGNVGKCYQSIARSGVPPALTLSLPLWICLLVSAFLVRPWKTQVTLC